MKQMMVMINCRGMNSFFLKTGLEFYNPSRSGAKRDLDRVLNEIPDQVLIITQVPSMFPLP